MKKMLVISWLHVFQVFQDSKSYFCIFVSSKMFCLVTIQVSNSHPIKKLVKINGKIMLLESPIFHTL